MKQFLYLDTDIVNSILAQEYKGLIDSVSVENGSVVSDSESINSQLAATGKFGDSLMRLLGLEIGLSSQVGSSLASSSSSSGKEIVSKTLHDASFDIAYGCMNPTIVGYSDDESETGSYIELTRVFDFVDFEYLESLFQETSLLGFMRESSAATIKEGLENSRASTSQRDAKKVAAQVKRMAQEAVRASNKQFDDVEKMVGLIKSLVPYGRMLISGDGYLIPFEDKYFRVNPSDLGFKYGGEITCVGMVTNIIGRDADPDDSGNMFATLQYNVNEVLRALLPCKDENIVVVHPIAVYYG